MDKAQSKAPARSLVSIDDVGNATAFLALDGAKLITGERALYRRRLSHHRLSVGPRRFSDSAGRSARRRRRALAAFDLDHEVIVDAQAVGRHVLGFGDGDAAAQPRAGRHRRQIADPVGAVVQRIRSPSDPSPTG